MKAGPAFPTHPQHWVFLRQVQRGIMCFKKPEYCSFSEVEFPEFRMTHSCSSQISNSALLLFYEVEETKYLCAILGKTTTWNSHTLYSQNGLFWSIWKGNPPYQVRRDWNTSLKPTIDRSKCGWVSRKQTHFQQSMSRPVLLIYQLQYNQPFRFFLWNYCRQL